MALTATQHNMNDVRHAVRGSRTGVRTAANFTITLGFEPKYVKVTNLTDRISAEWFSEGDNTKQLLTVAAGTRTYEASGIAVSGNAFTVTVATQSLETDDDDVVWEAHA